MHAKAVRDAYFSRMASARHGYLTYVRANGDLVHITEVTRPGVNPISIWYDLKYCGQVVRFLPHIKRKAKRPPYKAGDIFKERSRGSA